MIPERPMSYGYSLQTNQSEAFNQIKIYQIVQNLITSKSAKALLIVSVTLAWLVILFPLKSTTNSYINRYWQSQI